MTWTEKLSVGIRVIDDDHKRLIGLLNELYDAMQAGRGRQALGNILDGLIQYTKLHFAREEKFFADTGYPGAIPHKQEHEKLTSQVLEVQQKYAAGSSAALSIAVLNFLQNWLMQHIQVSDQRYRPHFTSCGIH